MSHRRSSFDSPLATRLVVLLMLLGSWVGASPADKDVYFGVWRDQAYHNYAQPVATYFTTMFNSGWQRTVAIDRPFEWNVGLSMPFAIRLSADKTFEVNGQTLPTLVGDDKEVNIPGAPINPIHGSASFLFGLLLPTVEAGVNFWYTALDFRLMYLPTFSISSDDYSVAWFGFGLRHDVSHYIPKSIPVDLAIGWHATWWGLDYTARNVWFGDHSIDGFSHVTSLLIGKRFGSHYEVMGEIGWERGEIDVSGAVEKRADDKVTVIVPEFATKGTVRGRNGFKIGVALSLHFGSTSGVGVHYGSQVGGWFRLFSIPKINELGSDYRFTYEGGEKSSSGEISDSSELPEATSEQSESSIQIEALSNNDSDSTSPFAD